MDEYTAEDILRLLDSAGVNCPLLEHDLFKKHYDEMKGDPINTAWKIFSEILPFEVYFNNDERMNYLKKIKRDSIFQEKIIDSGIAKKLRLGVPLSDLVKNPKISSFS